jgi:DNA (cytosine-5)-methyltransferase 1
VFIVSDFGGESCDEILAITESLPGHPPPSREAGKGTAGDATKGVGEGGAIAESDIVGTLSDGAHMGGGLNGQDAYTGRIMAVQGADVYSGSITGEIGCTVTTKTGVGDGSGPKVMSFAPSDLKRGFGQKPEIELSGTLKKEHNDQSPHVVTSQQGGEGVGVATYEWHNQDSRIREQQQASTLSCNAGGKEGNLVRENLTVRRLTPIECERLQGFPDNWTSEKMELILEGNEWKATGKVVKQADGPRYKAMGNAVTVNVAEWIGKQIGKVLNK